MATLKHGGNHGNQYSKVRSRRVTALQKGEKPPSGRSATSTQSIQEKGGYPDRGNLKASNRGGRLEQLTTVYTPRGRSDEALHVRLWASRTPKAICRSVSPAAPALLKCLVQPFGLFLFLWGLQVGESSDFRLLMSRRLLRRRPS